MSDIMLHGVLNMPPELWIGTPIDVMQRHSRYIQASEYIKELTEQRDRLAEVMQQMWPFIEEGDYPNCNTPEFNAAILEYKEALQSLTTNEL
jgi:hypothetical protein